MKLQLKIADAIVQTVLIALVPIYFNDWMLWKFEIYSTPIYILAAWQIISNVVNYIVGWDEATIKGRRRYTKAVLIDLTIWVVFYLVLFIFFRFILIMLYAQLLFSAIMALSYLQITIKEAVLLYRNSHENINHRWMNL